MSKGMQTVNNAIIDSQLKKSHRSCRAIVKKSGSNFYYGMWLTLDKKKRDALFSIYAWMRAIDDIADSPLPNKEKIHQLNDFYQTTISVIEQKIPTYNNRIDFDSFWPAFQQTIHEYAISLEYFKHMFLGQIQSVQQYTYDNFADLYQYCYRVAATVGFVCIAIWGYKGGESTLKLAEYRGIALQLINVVRDIQNDVLNNHKFFIPKDWFNHEESLIAQLIKSKDKTLLMPLVQEIIGRAEYYYEASRELEHRVSRTGSLSLRVMSRTYFSLLQKIKKNPYLVLRGEKVKLNHFEKISISLLCFVQWCFNA